MFSRKSRAAGRDGAGDGPADPVVDAPRAVLAVAVSAMVGDGEVNDAEIVQLGNICTLSPIFYGVTANEINEASKAVVDAIAYEGHEAVILRAAAHLSPDLRETAFAFAVRIVVADGVINDAEAAALNAIGGWLEIDVETGRRILDVMMIMQRGLDA